MTFIRRFSILIVYVSYECVSPIYDRCMILYV